MDNNNSKKNKKFSKVMSRSGKNGDAKQRLLGPPPISPANSQFMRFRYVSSAIISGGTFGAADLFATATMAKTATTATSLWVSARVVSVKLWGPPLGTVTLVPGSTGSQFGTKLENFVDTSANNSTCSFVKWRPDPESFSGQWFNGDSAAVTGGYTVFTFTCPSGSTLDLTLEVQLNNLGTAHYRNMTPSGLTAGVIYSATPTTNVVPVGWPTY